MQPGHFPEQIMVDHKNLNKFKKTEIIKCLL